MPQEIATLAGGCFWCLEAVFAELQGVVNVQSGYSGGTVPNPGYQAVCTGETGHAEVVQIRFEPRVISFADLLRVFFSIHNPTTLNRQGADVGTQYRSAIFYHSEKQKEIAEQVKAEMAAQRVKPVVTEITPFEKFYPAEAYHRNYFARNGNQAYCRAVISPKVESFREKFAFRLKRP
jgi:peptide-methionine (S)-S-oxide reductase